MLHKVASYHVDRVVDAAEALSNPEASKRFKLIVAQIKEALDKNSKPGDIAVAPKSKDFLYFTARSITAMEAANLDKEGNMSGDGHLSVDDGSGKCKVCQQSLEENPEGKKTAGLWHSANGLEPYVNDNGDAFPLDELVPKEESQIDKNVAPQNKKVKGYRSFVGRGLFTNHQSDDVEKVRGIILDSYWDPKSLYAVNLVAVDKIAHPQFARDIEQGIISDVSMGTQVDYSLCSICANRAVTEQDYCFGLGTQIELFQRQPKNIEAIKVGDEVITHTGKVKKVTKTFVNVPKDDFLKIKIYGYQNPIECTGNHPILVLKKDDIKCNSNGKRNICSFYTHDHEVCDSCGRSRDEIKKIDYIHAHHLNVGDHIVYPIDQKVKHQKYLTKEFARLLGYFVAEGNFIKDTRSGRKGKIKVGIQFSFNKNEVSFIEEVTKLCQVVTNKEVKVYRDKSYNKPIAVINLYDENLANHFYKLCGEYAKNKILSNEVLEWSHEYQMEFLKTLINGDGFQSTKEGSIYLSTASQNLAHQVWYICLRNGIQSWYQSYTRKKSYGGFGKTNDTEYQLRIGKRNCKMFADGSKIEIVEYSDKFAGRSFIYDNYYFAPIISIEEQELPPYVYNFEVQDDNSYIANNVAVHNCDHIKNYKGLRLAGKKVYEVNYGLSFIELSAVTTGADRNCKILEKIAMLNNLVSNRQQSLDNDSSQVEIVKKDINEALTQIAQLKDQYSKNEKKGCSGGCTSCKCKKEKEVEPIISSSIIEEKNKIALSVPTLKQVVAENIKLSYAHCPNCDAYAKLTDLQLDTNENREVQKIDGKLVPGPVSASASIVPIYECLNCEAKSVGKRLYHSDKSDLHDVLKAFDGNTLKTIQNDLLERGIAEAEVNNILDRFKNSINLTKEGGFKMSRSERLARAQKRQAYFQGTVDPQTKKGPEGAEDYKSDPMSEKVRNTQDKQMLQTKSMGGTTGMFPGDEQTKKKLQRAEKEGGNSIMKKADLEARANARRAYFQGTVDPQTKKGPEGAEDYKSDPMSEKVRNTQDKQMLQTKSMGGTTGMFPGDEQLKTKLQRATLKAKFTRMADAGEARKASKWTIYASLDDKETPILTASVAEIFGDTIDKTTGYKKASGENETNWDWVSSQEYGQEVMKAIREQGYETVVATLKGPEALKKEAQAAPAPAPAAPPTDPAMAAPAAPPTDPMADPAMAAGPDAGMEEGPDADLIDEEVGEEEAKDTDASAASAKEAISKLEEATQDLTRIVEEAFAGKDLEEVGSKKEDEEDEKKIVNIDMEPEEKEAALAEMGIVHYQLKDAVAKLSGASKLLRSGSCEKASYRNIKAFKRVVAELLSDANDVITDVEAKKKKGLPPWLKDKKKDKKEDKKEDCKKSDKECKKDASLAQRKAARQNILNKIAEDLYSSHKELQPAGEKLINEAHPGGGPTLADASGDGGKFETIIEQQKKDLPVATKNPTGKTAASDKQTKVAETAGGAKGAPAGGADKEANAYWKGYWGSEGKEPAYAAGLTQDFTTKKSKASADEMKEKIKRAYDVALDMQKKGMIGTTKEALDAEVESISSFDNQAFESFKKAIDNIENPKQAAAQAQVKTAALNQSLKVGLRSELADNEFNELQDIFNA